MKHPFPAFRYALPVAALTWIALMLFSAGCASDDSYETIDFDDTVRELRTKPGQQEGSVLRVAVGAMISPEKTIENYQELIEYIGQETGLATRIVQRKTYEEVNELIERGDVDIAFICTGPYILGKRDGGFEAMATPVVRGEPYYQAYLIVHRDSPYETISDLSGKVFAFTDPASNTGAAVPTRWVAELGETPDTFFERVHYTYSHDNSIMAVAASLVDGASIDGHIWEYYDQTDPENTSKTRIIRRSEPYGSPPLVASAHLDETIKNRIRDAVLDMHQSETGAQILANLMIDRFTASKEEWYETAQSTNRYTDTRAGDDEEY